MKKSIFYNNDIIDPRFKKTIFRVEATPYEILSLWEYWHDKVTWEEDNNGTVYQTGWVGKRPVVTSMRWVKINGCYVLFYDNTSEVVDNLQVENWFKKNCNPKWGRNTRTAHSDAMNFAHCIHAIEEIKGEKQ